MHFEPRATGFSHGSGAYQGNACARPFSARTSARGVLPQAVGETLHVRDPRAVRASESAMLADCLPSARLGTLTALRRHIIIERSRMGATYFRDKEAFCGDTRHADLKRPRQMSED
jgi:hypothetical protein